MKCNKNIYRGYWPQILNGHGKENILENAEKFIEANIDYYRL